MTDDPEVRTDGGKHADGTEQCPECGETVEPKNVRKRLMGGRISHQRRCPNCDAFLGAGKKTVYNGEEFVTVEVGEKYSTESDREDRNE